MICISKSCRLCLSKSNTLVNIKHVASDKVSYLSKLQLIAPTLIENPRNDLMVWICELCRQKLNDAYNFIQLCLKSDALIEKYCLQLTSSYTPQNEYNNSDESVFNLTENNVKESIYKPIKEECILEDESFEIDDNQKGFESLFILDKHELPPVNLKIKLESNDLLMNYDIPSSFDSIENVPKAFSVLLKQEPDFNTDVNDEIFLTKSSLNQDEILPIKQITDTNSRSNTTSSSDDYNDLIKDSCERNINASNTLATNRSIKSEKCLNQKFRRQKRAHSGERTYNCNMCSKKFHYSSFLKRHERTHTGELPYKCNMCSKKFNDSGNLKRHERTHSSERPFKCNMCPKQFNESASLKVHERTHTGERPYKCNICHKKFNESNNLKVHERIHSGERPYKCNMCLKQFNRSSYLKTHERIHTGERPYNCNMCSKKFHDSGNLKRHERTHGESLQVQHVF